MKKYFNCANIFVALVLLMIVINYLLFSGISFEIVLLSAIAFISYLIKSYLDSKVPEVVVVDTERLEKEVQELKNNLSALSTMVGFTNIGKRDD